MFFKNCFSTSKTKKTKQKVDVSNDTNIRIESTEKVAIVPEVERLARVIALKEEAIELFKFLPENSPNRKKLSSILTYKVKYAKDIEILEYSLPLLLEILHAHRVDRLEKVIALREEAIELFKFLPEDSPQRQELSAIVTYEVKYATDIIILENSLPPVLEILHAHKQHADERYTHST